MARQLPLPPSPALIASRIESQTSSLLTSLSSLLSRSPFPHTLHTLRTSLSSVLSIHLLILTLEAFGLRAQVLPLRCLTTMPPFPSIGLSAPTSPLPPSPYKVKPTASLTRQKKQCQDDEGSEINAWLSAIIFSTVTIHCSCFLIDFISFSFLCLLLPR